MNLERQILLTPREGLQTPGSLPRFGWESLRDPLLKPPCQLVESAAINLLGELTRRRDLSVELPNPISCPSAARMISRILITAQTLGIADRVPVHTRMKKEDFKLAIACGAKAGHLYGNSSNLAGEKGKSIDNLLENLSDIADDAYIGGVNHLRASLEQATATPVDKIAKFIAGVKKINDRFPRNVITGLGLPDTNGLATPDQYRNILTPEITNLIREAGLTLFIHLHNDGGKAIDNAQTIMDVAKREAIPVVVEVAPKEEPGERLGILWFEDLATLGFTDNLPDDAHKLLAGDSWVRKYPELRNIALKAMTAGVHTDDMKRYSNGHVDVFPSPGLYTIMGARNFGFIQQHVLDNTEQAVSTMDVLKSAALIGRELAAQYGNQPQAVAIALAEIAFQNPELILSISQRFNRPEGWLGSPSIDLRPICDLLQKIVMDKWKFNLNFQEHNSLTYS